MPKKIARGVTRLCLIAVVAVAALVGSRSAALADCGMHAFNTINVPILKQDESTPLTPEAIMRVNGGMATLANVGGQIPLPCPDEPTARNYAAVGLTSAWASAIRLRASEAAMKIVMSGGSNIPAACLSIEPVLFRSTVAGNYATFFPSRPEVLAEMRKSPYFAHISALWAAVFAGAGMTRPPIGTSAIVLWSQPALKAANAAKAHEPPVPAPGCMDDPMTAAPKS